VWGGGGGGGGGVGGGGKKTQTGSGADEVLSIGELEKPREGEREKMPLPGFVWMRKEREKSSRASNKQPESKKGINPWGWVEAPAVRGGLMVDQ